MFRRVLAETSQAQEITYNFLERKVYSGSNVYNNIDVVYFDGDVWIEDGALDYQEGKAEIKFSYPVSLSVETETIDGIVTILVVRPTSETTQALIHPFITWKPGELLGRLLEGRKKPRYPYASKVKNLHYDAYTKRATTYNSETKTFDNIYVITFAGLGKESKVQPDRALLKPMTGYTFTVVQRDHTLQAELVGE